MKGDVWQRFKNYLGIIYMEFNLHRDKREVSISEIKWEYLHFGYFWGCKKIEKNQNDIQSIW